MAGHKKQCPRTRAFTLLELAIVIAVIAILASVFVPPIFATFEQSRRAVTKETLRSLASAMKRFHDETGVWPNGNTVWNPATNTLVGPVTASSDDTAMFTPPLALLGLPLCAASSGPLATRCWGGPYLSNGASLGDPSVRDGWGRPFRYAYLPKGHVAAPNGIIVLWSVGQDGTDQTTDPLTFARGAPSVTDADDIIQVVGSAW